MSVSVAIVMGLSCAGLGVVAGMWLAEERAWRHKRVTLDMSTERLIAAGCSMPSRPLRTADLSGLLSEVPDDNTLVAVEWSDGGALATGAWVQASDALPAGMGGTDPMREPTVGVLIIETGGTDRD